MPHFRRALRRRAPNSMQCGLHFSEPDERPNTHPASTLTMISANYTLAPFTNKTVPNDADRSTYTSNPTRKRKADVALGRPVGSPLKHRGRTDSFNAGHLRGKGFDRYDLDGLCIFDSLALDGLTMLHDEKGEAHLIVPNAGGAIGGRRTASAMLQAVTHRHIIWGSQHSVDPVVALPWQEGPSIGFAPAAGSATETNEMLILPTTNGGTVEISAAEWIDAVLEGLDDRSRGLAVSDPHPTPKGTVTDPSVPHTKVAAESPKASPFFCDFFEIGPPGSGFDHIDADKDLGQDLTFEEI